MTVQRSKVKTYLDIIAYKRKSGQIDQDEANRLISLVKEGLSGKNVNLPDYITGQL